MALDPAVAAEWKFNFKWIMEGREFHICLHTGSGGSGGMVAFLGKNGVWTEPHGNWQAGRHGTIMLWFRFNYRQGEREGLRMATVTWDGLRDCFVGRDYKQREISMMPISAYVGEKPVAGPEKWREINQAVLGDPSHPLPSVENPQFVLLALPDS